MRRLVAFGIIFVLVSGAIASALGLSTLLSGEASPPVLEPTPTPRASLPVEPEPTPAMLEPTATQAASLTVELAPAPPVAEPAPTPVPAEPGPTPIPKPIPTPDQPTVEPEPWPPEELREEIISLALSDPQTQDILEGHRYRVFDISAVIGKKSGPCASTGSFPPLLNCAWVMIYDYTVSTRVVVTVDFHNNEVVDRFVPPGYQPLPPEEEFIEITRIIMEDPRFGPSAVVPDQVPKQIVDTDLGGNCGTLSPLHRCLLVGVQQAGSEETILVTVDLVDKKVVRIHPPGLLG